MNKTSLSQKKKERQSILGFCFCFVTLVLELIPLSLWHVSLGYLFTRQLMYLDVNICNRRLWF